MSREIEVSVPQGCSSDDELAVEIDGQDFLVTVPSGLPAGAVFVVSLPSSGTGEVVEATVPDLCFAGDAFTLTVDQSTFEVTCPEGCGPGSVIQVELPLTAADHESPASPLQHHDESCEPLHSVAQAACAAPESSDDAHSLQGVVSMGRPHSFAGKSRLPAVIEADSTSDSDMGGAAEEQPKFAVGSPVEVFRSDGWWTLTTVTDYDAGGDTYTVRLADGRSKYFVEPSDLRIPRFLLKSTGMI